MVSCSVKIIKDRQSDRKKETDRVTERQTEAERGRETDRLTERQTG